MMHATVHGGSMTDADKRALDTLEREVLPLLERESLAIRDHDHARTVGYDARAALAMLQPCLQLRAAERPSGEAPILQNANVMRRAQDAQRRVEEVIAAVDGRTAEWHRA
jgi:hypothetical protein